MPPAKKSIAQEIAAQTKALKEVQKRLSIMARLAKMKPKAAKAGARVVRGGGRGLAAAAAAVAAAPAPAGQRAKVITQLIGILHAGGVTSPNIGPASVYANPPIGFSQLRMDGYCQTCRTWFRCPGLADQAPTITVNQMATAVLNAGGLPR